MVQRQYFELAGSERPYANLYAFGAASSSERPLVLYFGGAVSPAVYEARRSTAPSIVADVFAAALARVAAGTAVDLVVCPCPLHSEGALRSDDAEAWVTSHYDAILDRLRGARRPSALATLGFSAGAPHALRLGALEGVATAVLGGAGTKAALHALRGVLASRAREGEPLALAHAMNLGDPLGLAGDDWLRSYESVVALSLQRAPGVHAFADYVDNGLAEEAFAFVVRRVLERR